MQCIVIGDFMIVCYLDSSQKNIDIDKQRDIVNQKLKSGLSRLKTAKEVGISIVSLYNFLKQNPELKKTATGGQRA